MEVLVALDMVRGEERAPASLLPGWAMIADGGDLGELPLVIPSLSNSIGHMNMLERPENCPMGYFKNSNETLCSYVYIKNSQFFQIIQV